MDKQSPCKETYITLRIFSDEISVDEITRYMGIEATKTQVKGSFVNERRGKDSIRFEKNGWFLSSLGSVTSTDICIHIDWMNEQIPKTAITNNRILGDLENRVFIDFFCYWVSAWGHGGPTVSSKQLNILAKFGVDFGFDVYFDDDETSS